jgi:hypothetical protein
MKREVLCVLVVFLAGCLGGVPPVGSSDAPAYPDRPAPLSRDNALAYTTGYERAAEYRDQKEIGNRVELGCNSTLINETAAGFYIAAGCGTTVYGASGGVGNGGPGHGRLYFVNDTTTIRMTPRDAPERSSETTEKRGTAETTLYYSNFDGNDHALTTTLTYLGSTPPERVLRSTDSIDAQQGVEREDVPLRTGTYRITVRLDDGSTVTRRWAVSERSAWDSNALSVYVTPDGDLAVVDRPWIRV